VRSKKKDGNQAKNKYKMQCMELSIAKIEETVSEIKKYISRTRSTLDAHINRQYTEIRVIEKDGKWGDYSGTFYVNDEEEQAMVLQKAKEHFKTYFEDGIHHNDKKLGLFLFSPKSGKRLIEEMKT
tara:strand:+ start:1939 stop:2316 length:378 start_codon:yes stop_codon:yes gene_type:complete